MFEVSRTVIDGVEHERVESDYRLELSESDSIQVRTPWMSREDSSAFPRCICEDHPKLRYWEGSEAHCPNEVECGSEWELGWGESEFFLSPEEEQTEEGMIEKLRKLEMDGTYQIRAVLSEEETEASRDNAVIP